MNSEIMLDYRINTRDGWVPRVTFIHVRTSKRAYVLKEELNTYIKQAGVSIAKTLKMSRSYILCFDILQ